MAWGLGCFTDKAAELGWLESILSSDIRFLFARPWLFRFFKGGCIHNSLITVSKTEMPMDRKSQRRGLEKKRIEPCHNSSSAHWHREMTSSNNLRASHAPPAPHPPRLHRNEIWHTTNQWQLVSVNHYKQTQRPFYSDQHSTRIDRHAFPAIKNSVTHGMSPTPHNPPSFNYFADVQG